jgi:orotidine-5'-phosphate decarboxylase
MDQLLVALDVDTGDECRRIAAQLRGIVGGFKIGSRLFTSEGPSIVQDLIGRGDRVFLDLKFHDIPHTVAGAVAAAVRQGVWMINVHASGGPEMMRAARRAVDDEAQRLSRPAPLLIAVTMLTSLNQSALEAIGLESDMATQVGRLASLAQASGLDGVVASPQEITLIRARCGDRFTIVTPGIRGPGDSKDDQSRTLTTREALAKGASYVVVGRPIVAAADPRAAAERIAAESRR